MNWTALAKNLASILVETGDLASPHWKAAFEETPRHVFVPAYFQSQGGTPTVWKRVDSADGEDWYNPIYTNTTLVTRLDQQSGEASERQTSGVPTSSSTQPSLTARMLEILDIQEDDEVLDAGTGSGYQAALIAHRQKGAQRLVTADIDPELTEAAQASLKTLGYEPDVLTVDVSAWRWQKQFHKVIVTCSLPRITATLQAAVAPGGRLVANVFPPLSSALAVLDAHSDGRLEGRFHVDGGSFMPARGLTADPRPSSGELPDESEGATDLPITAFDSYHFNFLLAAQLPGVQLQYGTDDNGQAMRRLVMPDGTWAAGYFPADEPSLFRESGARGIWETVVSRWAWFVENGHPTWDRFGLTVTPEGEHRIWFETPEGPSWVV
ncbi:methyltransferase domain-containing protein [Streptomyces sp. NPDC058773]|uniref:methyltransferase domain-containing protein n=1 Tax=Streptomyces sp. NPDC058773 TaxID=3346632 RepID=UPI003695ABF0